MKRKQLFARSKIYTLAFLSIGAFFFVSCAEDGYDDDERFSSDVKNTVLTSPLADSITISVSTDGSTSTIKWPVVLGAGGYLCSVYDVTNPEDPVVVDSIEDKEVDGCSLAVTRAEDSNYKFIIKTLGNTTYGNSDATTSTEKTFTSFTPTYATIPAGSDIYEYFQNNPLPANSGGDEYCIDLESGGQYTMSNYVDFSGCRVTLRCTNKYDKPTITFGETGGFRTSVAMTLKNLNFVCDLSSQPFITLSSTPVDSLLNILGGTGGYYVITDPIYITDCEISGITSNFIYDNNVKYCLGTMLVNDCVVHMKATGTSISSQAYFYFKGGFINSLTIKNSTFWNSGVSDAKYFVQYNNSGRCDRAGYLKNYISYLNSTFYNMVKAGQMGNYSGFNGKSTSIWDFENCIYVDCGSGQVPRRLLGGSLGSSVATFNYNTYLCSGIFESTVTDDGYTDASAYDKSGTIITVDPGFKDAANGDFTVSGADQIAHSTGDPRWIP
jgi:hypothetical protein